jgi:ABC-type polysaccharide/polyol phosphate transport system ATPase subunit
MSSPPVLFEGVWKKFRRGERHDSLRDLVPSAFKSMARRARAGELGSNEFWVLRDVSFSVDQGQALGIIGANGAGKSTTLKLLTKILRATKGNIAVRGRVGALIEVAAGFHPDLTGRENVFLQGAIMGMRSKDITRKFDEIVEFSGIADFIDTPVKRYSSGMNARLGFSIAAHLEPDVLLIDEVLSVGDFKFQSRAFSKISELVRRHIPVVVVSHQLDQIAMLCTHAIYLEHGSIAETGSPNDCIRRYLAYTGDTPADQAAPVKFHRMSIDQPGPYRPGDRITIRLSGETLPAWEGSHEIVGIRLRTQAGLSLFNSGVDRFQIDLPREASFELEMSLNLNLSAGSYLLDAMVWHDRRERQTVAGPVLLISMQDSEMSQLGPAFLNVQGRLVNAKTAVA